MRRSFCVAGALLATFTLATAQVNPPAWWDSQDPNAAYGSFNFGDPNNLFEWDQDSFWPFGNPQVTSGGNLLYYAGSGGHTGLIGVEQNDVGWIDFLFLNEHRSDWVKHVWFQFESRLNVGSSLGFTVEAEPGSQQSNLQFLVEDLGDRWYRDTWSFDYFPQPGWERIRFEIHGTYDPGTYIDTFSFGTFCEPVPEPGSLAALCLGAMALLRRRRE